MKTVKILRNIFFWVLVAITGSMMIFTLICASTLDQAHRTIFGYKAFIILTDSMKKTDFDAGDLILVKEVDPATLQEGDIISYISQSSNSFGKTITHKIRCLTTTTDGDSGFITYGTTTGTDDEQIVTYPCVVGKYQFCIPNLGYFFHFLKTVPGYLICILLPFFLLILIEAVHCIRLFRKYRAEQRALLQAERDELEAEREKNQRLLHQIMAMKAQIDPAVELNSSPFHSIEK